MELWRGTMTCHSIVAYRSDVSRGGVKFPFDDDRWPSYVPLRLPTTICVRERLPSGAAGVLINQTHAYRDLILPIDSTEKRLFDAIDGRASIGSIVERTLPSSQTKSQLDMARTFFEKLWWHDQVVFDASLCHAR
jgi:hypothetical protein